MAGVQHKAAQHVQVLHLYSQGRATLLLTGTQKALAHLERPFRLLPRFSCYPHKKPNQTVFSFIIARIGSRGWKTAWKPLLRFVSWTKYLLSSKLRLSFRSSPSLKQKCADVSPRAKARKKTLAGFFPEIWGRRGSFLFWTCITKANKENDFVWLQFLWTDIWSLTCLSVPNKFSWYHFPLWIPWDVCLVSPWLAN